MTESWREDAEAALRGVIDPEVGINILDLGLIYGLDWDGQGTLRVRMTMTTPACPLGAMLTDEVQAALQALPGVREVAVELVWEPEWTPARMTSVARRQLGLED